MTSITPPCHVERSRDISAALAAWREPKYLLRRFYEISPRALLVFFVFIHFVLVNPKTICIFAAIIKTIGV